MNSISIEERMGPESRSVICIALAATDVSINAAQIASVQKTG